MRRINAKQATLKGSNWQFLKKGGPPYRPPSTIILKYRRPQEGTQNFGKLPNHRNQQPKQLGAPNSTSSAPLGGNRIAGQFQATSPDLTLTGGLYRK